MPPPPSNEIASPGLARRLGLFDVAMIVMGGIIGSGIFMNPAVVAQRVHTPLLILGAWLVGGVIAIIATFIYVELSSRRPETGGQYAYIREAFHPSIAFLYGWGLLLVTQTGGMAAVAVTFSRYFRELTHSSLGDGAIAAIALAALTAINCLGVRAGSTLQNVLMVLKIGAVLALVACGWFLPPGAAPALGAPAPLGPPGSSNPWSAFGAALVPVLFAYGGAQTSTFIAGEMRDPRRVLPRALLLGVGGVIVLYLAVNLVCIQVLGTRGLAASSAPASDVMRAVLGEPGARFIALCIAISTLGFLSQSMLTAPRVYYAMAQDGARMSALGWLHPRTRVPVVAIALQGAAAIVIALSGRYEQILNYVVSVDWIFFALAAASVFALRRKDAASGRSDPAVLEIPGHPVTTLAFILGSGLIVLNTAIEYPANSLIGLGILAAGIPVYLWGARRRP